MGSTAPSTFQDSIEGKLITPITTSTTTGITYKIKQVNGATPTHPTAAHRLHVIQRTALVSKHEIFDVAAGTTQSGQTVTLGTVTRALPLNDGTTFSGTGTAQSFSAGADLFLSWDAHDAAQTLKADIVNTITGAGAIRGSSTSTPIIRLNNVTTAQRTAMSPANGDLVYDTDLGEIYQYKGGAWAAVGDTGTSDGSTAVAGKFEEATVAEQGTATATGATGARLVPAVANLVKTSSGAGDENKIAVLGSTGKLAAGFIPESLSSVNFYGDGRDGTVVLGSNTTLTADKYYMNLDLGSYTLTTAGFRVFVRGLLTGTGKIVSNGVVGSAGANAASGSPGAGGAAGSTPAAGILPAAISPAAGGAGAASGAVGTAGTSIATAVTNAVTAVSTPANGGKGGDSSINSGAAGGTGGTSTAYGSALTTQDAFYWALITNGAFTRIGTLPGAAGGGGGSCNAGVNTAGGGGGGGGGNGGAIVVAAYIIEGSFTFESKGAAGGAGGSGFAGTGQGGGGGGGGGGHGGHILVIYNYKTSWSGSATVTGGAGGAGGSGTGGGTADGVAGVTGTAGSITYIAL